MSLRSEIREKVERAREKTMKEKLQNKEMANVVKRVLIEKRQRDIEEDLSLKRSRKYHLLYDKNESLSRKIKTLEEHQSRAKQTYGDRILDKCSLHEDNVEKIRQLEELESMLVDKLKQTHSRQQAAYSELDKIVNESYGYYLQSYVERKDKHLKLFSNGKEIPSARGRNATSVLGQYLTSHL